MFFAIFRHLKRIELSIYFLVELAYLNPYFLPSQNSPKNNIVTELTKFSISQLPFEVVVEGKFPPDKLQTIWRPNWQDFPEEEKTKMERHWNQETARHTFLFNGELCRLVASQEKDGFLVLELEYTNYQELLYSNHLWQSNGKVASSAFLARAVGVSAVLFSADDQLFLIRRSKKVGESPGKLDVIGGHVEPPRHMVNGHPDPFMAIRDELEEEINLHVVDDSELVCLGLIEANFALKPELIFLLESKLDTDTIMRQHEQAPNPADEVGEFFHQSGDRQALEEIFSKRKDDFSESALGALWLFYNSIE